ncbi:MAG: hypothetical protein JWM69_37, partial [Candidatus Binatus sp.]|nr:hypothetical protein [Candidatus Binatus sp.]
MQMPSSSLEEALAALRDGKMIVMLA